MMILMEITSILYLAASSQFKNPMKMCMAMTIGTGLLMWLMQAKMGKSWFSLNIYLLYMGGIMMMFMILSSTLPNSKMKKNKTKMLILYATMVSTGALMNVYSESSTNMEQISQMKWFFNNSENMSILIMSMLLYFFIFNSLLKKSKTSMRSSQC